MIWRPPQTGELLVNADGRYFINYLSECIVDTYDGEELDSNALKKHKDQIENALTQYAAQPKVFAKFSWLSAYHNFFCDSVSSFPGYCNKLKINREAATVKFKRLGHT